MRLVEHSGAIVDGEIRFKDELLVGFEEAGRAPRERAEMLSNEQMRQRIRGREIAIIFQDPMESRSSITNSSGIRRYQRAGER